MYKIPADIEKELKDFFAQYSFIDKVVVFGSRARGDNAKKSDIDICIYSLEMSDSEFRDLRYELNELPILYHIDIVHFEKINDELRENILKDGKLFFVPMIKQKDDDFNNYENMVRVSYE